MTTKMKFRPLLLAAGCVAVSAGAAAPASAATTPYTSSQVSNITFNICGENGCVGADVAAAPGSTVSGSVLLKKRTLCRIAKQKVPAAGTVGIRCGFRLRNFAKLANARASGPVAGAVVITLVTLVAADLVVNGKLVPPVMTQIPVVVPAATKEPNP